MNSNKKLFSVLLTAVLLVACTVGVLIFGANAATAPTEWTLGQNGVPADIEGALAYAAEQDWGKEDSLILHIPAGTDYVVNDTATVEEGVVTSYDPLLFGQTTIFREGTNNRLPITLKGASKETTVITVADAVCGTADKFYWVACANSYTFDSLTLDLGNNYAQFHAGSGQVVIAATASFGAALSNVHFYADNFTQAAYNGWTIPSGSAVFNKSSLTLTSAIAVVPRGMAACGYADNTFCQSNYQVDGVAKYSNPNTYAGRTEASLIFDGTSLNDNAYFCYSNNLGDKTTGLPTKIRGTKAYHVAFAEAVIEMKSGSLAGVRHNPTAVANSTMKKNCSFLMSGGTITASPYLLDYAFIYEKDLTVKVTGGSIPCHFDFRNARNKCKVLGTYNVYIEGNFTTNSGTSLGTVKAGSKYYFFPLSYATVGNYNLTLKDMHHSRLGNYVFYGVHDNATITGDCTITVDHSNPQGFYAVQGADIGGKLTVNVQGASNMYSAFFPTTGATVGDGVEVNVNSSYFNAYNGLHNTTVNVETEGRAAYKINWNNYKLRFDRKSDIHALVKGTSVINGDMDVSMLAPSGGDYGKVHCFQFLTGGAKLDGDLTATVSKMTSVNATESTIAGVTFVDASTVTGDMDLTLDSCNFTVETAIVGADGFGEVASVGGDLTVKVKDTTATIFNVVLAQTFNADGAKIDLATQVVGSYSDVSLTGTLDVTFEGTTYIKNGTRICGVAAKIGNTEGEAPLEHSITVQDSAKVTGFNLIYNAEAKANGNNYIKLSKDVPGCAYFDGNVTVTMKNSAQQTNAGDLIYNGVLNGNLHCVFQDDVIFAGQLSLIRFGSVNNIETEIYGNVTFKSHFYNGSRLTGNHTVSGDVSLTIEGTNVSIVGDLVTGGQGLTTAKAVDADNAKTVTSTLSGLSVQGSLIIGTPNPSAFYKEINSTITGNVMVGQHLYTAGGNAAKATCVIGSADAIGAAGIDIGRNVYNGADNGTATINLVETTVYSGRFGLQNELTALGNTGGGSFYCGTREAILGDITTNIYGGEFNGLRTGSYTVPEAVITGISTLNVYGAKINSTIYNSRGSVSTEDSVDYVLNFEPISGDIIIGKEVTNRTTGTQATKNGDTYTINFKLGTYSYKLGADAQLLDVTTVEEGVVFEAIDGFTSGKLIAKIPASEAGNFSFSGGATYEETTGGLIYVIGGEKMNAFFGLQPDVSETEMKITAYLNKATVEQLYNIFGDNFAISYSFVGVNGSATKAQLVSNGDYYTIDLGYIKASQFYLPYSFEAIGSKAIEGDFLALLAKNAADEAALDAEVKAILKALYAYGYQAGAAYDADFSYEDVAGLGTVADKEALIEKYQWTTLEEFYKAESNDETVYDIYGMGTKLGNQISISIYAIAPELAAGDKLTVKFNEDTLVEVTLKATTVKIGGVDTEVVYFTLNPSLNTMGDIYRMTILDGEAELGTATVSIAGYAVGVIEEEDLPEEELYYAILAYVDAASALADAQ